MSMNDWFNRQFGNKWLNRQAGNEKDSWMQAAQKSRNKTWNEMYRTKISEVDYEKHRRIQELREMERRAAVVIRHILEDAFQPGNIVNIPQPQKNVTRCSEKIVVLSHPLKVDFRMKWNDSMFSPELVLSVEYEAIINNQKAVYSSYLVKVVNELCQADEFHSFIDKVQSNFVVVSSQK